MDGTSAVYLYVSIECWGAWSVVPRLQPTKHNHVSRRESVLEPRPQQDLRPYGRYLTP